MRDLTNNSFIVSAVLKSYDLPESGDEYVMLSVVLLWREESCLRCRF